MSYHATTRAENYKARVGKWKPYMNKAFYLGNVDTRGEDGGKYIAAYNGAPAASTECNAYCDDELNAHCMYKIRFISRPAGMGFWVEKYEFDANTGLAVGDIIYASGTGGTDARYWLIKDTSGGTSSRGPWITIDLGVHVQFEGDVSDYSTDDRYMIRMPNCKIGNISFGIAGSEEGIDSMRKRRFYFGGLHTYLQLPPTERDAFHSDIIPASLEGKSISCLFGKIFQSSGAASVTWQETLSGCLSMEDDSGNSAVSMFLEYSVDKDAENSGAAGSNIFTWGAGEEWPLGTMIINDNDPHLLMLPLERVSYSTIPAVDASPSTPTTGTQQLINITTFGKAGYARVKTCYQDGGVPGASTILAHNQYWPCTLIIN